MGNVKRIYVEKKDGFAVKATELKEDLINYLNLGAIEDVRVFIRYDVENLGDDVFEQACRTVFSEPPVDIGRRSTFRQTVMCFPWSFCPDSSISARIPQSSAYSF